MLLASSPKILKAFTYNFLVPNYTANRNISKTVSVKNNNSNLQVCFFHLTFLLLGVGLKDIHLCFFKPYSFSFPVCVCIHVPACMSIHLECLEVRELAGIGISFTWVLGIELRLSGLVANCQLHCLIFISHLHIYKPQSKTSNLYKNKLHTL